MLPSESDSPKSRLPGLVYPILFFGLLTFSISPILVRLASDAPPLAIAAWRTVMAAGVLVPFMALRPAVLRPTVEGRNLLWVVVAGILLSLHFITWITSLYFTSVASASILVSTSPLFLGVLGYFILDERLPSGVVAAIVIAVVGAAVMNWGDVGSGVGGTKPAVGNLLAVIASLLFSFYLLIGRVLRQGLSWIAYVGPVYVVVALVTLSIALTAGTPLFGHGTKFYLLCAAMALGPQLTGHGAFNYVVKYMRAAIVGLLSLLEPIGASVLAYLLFAERPGALSITGMLVVLCAVLVGLARR